MARMEVQQRAEMQLRKEYASLKKRIEQGNGLNPDGVDRGGDLADRAAHTFEQMKDVALCRHREHRLRQMEEALHRIGGGNYGICGCCGQPIDPARLAVLPDAKFCVQCQRRRERKVA